MTRVKKNRSLKRIHSVKTGSISKLKRAAGVDRQVGKRVKGRRTLSAYEKFLLENPDASEAAKAAQKAAEKAALAKAEAAAEAAAKAESARTAKTEKETSSQDKQRAERPKSLLDQLDNKEIGDIY